MPDGMEFGYHYADLFYQLANEMARHGRDSSGGGMKRILIAAAAVLLAACSMGNSLKPYRLDVQQGNVVTQDMVAKLRPGMTKSQVRFILGSPLLVDIFHGNRWDYVYTYTKAGQLTEERKITVWFDGDLLQRISGDVVAGTPEEINPAPKLIDEPAAPKTEDAKPSGGEAAPAAGKPVKAEAPAQEEKGFFGKMLEKVGL